jgi:ATP-dependent Clp protease ATP-binding subunit ClpA
MSFFEKFDAESRRALWHSRSEAANYGSKVIDVVHILLGILRVSDEVVEEIFRRFEVKEDDLERSIEKVSPSAKKATVDDTTELPLTEEAKKVLAYASYEAESMLPSSVSVSVAHLLIAILRVENSEGARILTDHGFDIYTVREEVLAIYHERERGGQDSESRKDKRAVDSQEPSTSSGPDVIIIWDPEIVAEKDYAALVVALGDLVRANGGVGIKLGDPISVELSIPSGVLV